MADELNDPVSPMTGFSRSSTAASSAWNNIPPFEEENQLCTELTYFGRKADLAPHLQSSRFSQTLPDAPRIPLESTKVMGHCLVDLDTPGMNKLGTKLFHVGPSMHVKSLSDQVTIGRKIQVCEDISLHCVWTDDILFLKPVPAYLCSHAFWQYLLDPSNDSINPSERDRVRATSLGFLRSYANLIQRRSDFNLARKTGLLCSFGNTTFEDFIQFIMAFDALPDSAVSMRWRFGEIVLDALNLHSVIHLHKWHRHRYEGRYGAYFQRFFPVLLFMFTLFSIMLSAMQVILAAQPLKNTDNKGFKRTTDVFIWFGTESIAWSLAFGGLFVIWWIVISSNEAWKRHRLQKSWKKKLKDESALQP